MLSTADLCDKFEDALQYVEGNYINFGGKNAFHGPVSTILCFEDNSKVKEAIASPGNGRVLIVHGGGSLARALVGDQIASTACQNGWSGIIVHGCIRDADEIRGISIGVKALGTIPRKSEKRGAGCRDITVSFGNVQFRPGQYVVADSDGIVVGDIKLFEKLLTPKASL